MLLLALRTLYRLLPILLVSFLAACGGGSSTSTSAPVSITAQPVSATVPSGQAATFAVSAAGDGLSFQWQSSLDDGTTWNAIGGATSASLLIAAVDATMSGQQFRVVVTGTASAVTSSAVTLTVTQAVISPTVTVQPSNQAVQSGGQVTFTVTAAGTALAYQWQFSIDGNIWVDLAGATSASLVLPSVVLADSGKSYRVVVSNSAGTVTSAAAVLTVSTPPEAPVIGSQPVDAAVVAPQPATFFVTATGTPAPDYQWQVSTDSGATYQDIAQATSPSYTTPATSVSDSGKEYRVRVTNTAGTVTSSAAVITVSPTPTAPTFAAQPANQTVTAPAAATFAVSVTGTPSPTLQWQISTDGGNTFVNINGATSASYTTPATATANNGTRYQVIATNSQGTVVSNSAILTVGGVPTAAAAKRFASRAQNCAVLGDGSVSCWGSNHFGQVGDGTTLNRLTPAIVSGLSNIVAVAAGDTHSCAVRSDGVAFCWGNNSSGQLGDGTTTLRTTPTQVSGLTGAVAIAAGSFHTCALKADGTVWCWGTNFNGAIGNGNATNAITPLPLAVAGISGAVGLSAGYFNTCVIFASGTASCWGDNTYGQIGDNTTANRLTPTNVPGLNGVADLIIAGESYASASSVHACALLVDGTAVCWGSNLSGVLGDGTGIDHHVPTIVPGLSSLSAIAASYDHSCALTTSGAAQCWGNNSDGGLGNGGVGLGQPSPVPVNGLGAATNIIAGWGYTCALVGGSAYCWGANANGAIGDGTTTDRLDPTLVPGLSGLR